MIQGRREGREEGCGEQVIQGRREGRDVGSR